MSTSAWSDYLPLVDDEETTHPDVLDEAKNFFEETEAFVA